MNIDKYDQVFMDTFEVNDKALLPKLAYRNWIKWDSIGHMMLCAALEDAFNIHLDGNDILEIQSYESGKEVLKKYGIVIE